MNTLKIEQNSVPELVNVNIIHKLYEVALSIPRLDNEESSVHLEGNLQTPYAYRDEVNYLTDRFSDLHMNVTSDYYIKFEDEDVLSVLISKGFSSDGAHITETDASNVTFFPRSIFKNNDDIETFNELYYFGITDFRYESGKAYFEGCHNLREVTLPKNLNEIHESLFNECYNLEKINGLFDVDNINCTNFASTSLPSGQNYGKLYFEKAICLKCRNLDSLNLFGNQKFSQLYIPNVKQNSDRCGFNNYWSCSPWLGGSQNKFFSCSLIYLRDIEKLYCAAFAQIHNSAIVINNTTPPEWANRGDASDSDATWSQSKERMFANYNGGNSTITVYVPDTAVTAYQNHAMWGTQTTIKPISELNNGIRYTTVEDWEAAGKPLALIEEYM